MLNILFLLSTLSIAFAIEHLNHAHSSSHAGTVSGGHGHAHGSYLHRGIKNATLAGVVQGCKHQRQYVLSNHASFPMCVGQTDIDLKNGMSIINLIGSRGYLPTCRVMNLMLWMHSQVAEGFSVPNDFFVDVGSNIGSCAVHMAGLGFPVIAIEPVPQHVETIRGSIEINPSFNIELLHMGISSVDKKMNVNFGHGARNWGASEFHEVNGNQSFEQELVVRTLDQVIGHRKVALLKVDCEGCEWEALKGGKKSLRRIPLIKIELVQPEYVAGNETVSAASIVNFLHDYGFDLYIDHWNEQNLYFGKYGNEVFDIDKLFGSIKFGLGPDVGLLHQSAKKILSHPINPLDFNQRQFLKSATDVICIERSISEKMKKLWLNA